MDGWLKEVSNTEHVSVKGLAHLARCIEKKGYVCVSDAVQWVEIEKAESIAANAKYKREQGALAPGASALLERAQNECSGLFDQQFFSRAKSAIQPVMSPKETATSIFKGASMYARQIKEKFDDNG